MPSMNKVMIMGHLGKDPEVKQVGDSKVANFSVAATEKFKDRNGNPQSKTEWFNVVLWGRLAEISEQYLKKGSSVFIEGKLETRSWDDANGGGKKYRTEVRGMSMQMLSSGQQQSGHNTSSATPQTPPPAADSSFSIPPDDLPF